MLTINQLFENLTNAKEEIINKVNKKGENKVNNFHRNYGIVSRNDIYSYIESIIEDKVDSMLSNNGYTNNFKCFAHFRDNNYNSKTRNFKIEYYHSDENKKIEIINNFNVEVTCKKDTFYNYSIKSITFDYNISDKFYNKNLKECLDILLNEDIQKKQKEIKELPQKIERFKKAFFNAIKAMEDREAINYDDERIIKGMFKEYQRIIEGK